MVAELIGDRIYADAKGSNWLPEYPHVHVMGGCPLGSANIHLGPVAIDGLCRQSTTYTGAVVVLCHKMWPVAPLSVNIRCPSPQFTLPAVPTGLAMQLNLKAIF